MVGDLVASAGQVWPRPLPRPGTRGGVLASVWRYAETDPAGAREPSAVKLGLEGFTVESL